MSRDAVLSDAQWERISPLLPSSAGRRGRPFRDDRRVVEGIIWRYRVGTPWRDVPRSFGPWQTLWKRHRRYSGDGTWDRIHAELLADADAVGGDALKQVVIRKLFPAGVDGAAMAANVTALIEYRNRAVHLYAADLGEMVYPSCRPVF